MLTLSKIQKSFGSSVALHEIDLEVNSGETLAIIGPSGCGKSTLLRLMIGLLQPDSGQVTLDGQELCAENLREIRHRIGYVIQSGGLFPHLTARENTSLQGHHLGWSIERTAARIEELARLTRLPLELLERYPIQLSGGQRQRVSLVRALMLDPEVLLLDEPLGALDPMIRFDLQEDLRRIFRSLGKTVVLVTHDLSEAAFFADRIVLLDQGRIAQQGSFEDLWERPASDFVGRFVRAQRVPPALAGEAE
jgi:osmoprotectant transport system ATP-binding protein